MNILLIFPGFIIAFIIVLYYERMVRNPSKNPKNNVHFYVARDENGLLWLYLCKPIRSGRTFKTSPRGSIIESQIHFHKYGLNVNDYTNLKWEDEPVEVFLNLE